MSVQIPISIPLLSPTPHFNIYLDPYIIIVAVSELALSEGSATALPKPLRTQWQSDSERRMSGGTGMKEVPEGPKLLSMLSTTPSAGRPLMTIVPSTIPISVVTSSPVPTLSVQLPQAPLIGSPRALPFKLDVREDDPFA